MATDTVQSPIITMIIVEILAVPIDAKILMVVIGAIEEIDAQAIIIIIDKIKTNQKINEARSSLCNVASLIL